MHFFFSIVATLLITIASRGHAFLQVPQAVHFDFMTFGSTVNEFFTSAFMKTPNTFLFSLVKEAGSLKS
jgi:hypothetical protein